MTMNTRKMLRTAAFAACALAVPAVSFAATSQLDRTVTKTYQTTFVKDYGQAFPITGGTLKLTLTRDGYIQGYFMPPDSVAFVPVVGGRDGSNVWFDIGNANVTHVTGRLKGAAIVGYAVASNGVQYRFNAAPQAQRE